MKSAGLTDNEGALLALVVRAEPITAYQIGQVYGMSPVTNFNTSKGKLYAIIRRLAERGLLKATPVESDRRGTERLAATGAGRAAVRAWVMSARSEHLLLEDPLRTKIQSFDLLSPQERIDWCMQAKAMLEEKLREVDAYGDRVDVPFQDLVHDGAVSEHCPVGAGDADAAVPALVRGPVEHEAVAVPHRHRHHLVVGRRARGRVRLVRREHVRADAGPVVVELAEPLAVARAFTDGAGRHEGIIPSW